MRLTGLLSKAVWQWCISKKKKKSAFTINVLTRKDVIGVLNETEVSKRGEAALIWRGRMEKAVELKE